MSIDNVQDITPRSQYTLTAGQTVIPYPFPIFDQDDIVLDIDGVIKTITTHYTVSGVGADNGGNVTLVVAATGGETATVYRDTTIERTSDLQQNGPIRSSTYNDDMDRLHLILQELTLSDQRSIRVSQNDEVDFDDLELPAASSRASRFLIFDANGGVTTSAGTGADSGLRSDIASGATAAIIRRDNVAALTALTGMSNDAIAQTLGYYTDNDGGHGTYRYDSTSTATVNGGTVINAAGGVGRWLLEHNGWVFLKQFGAKGDGTTNDSAAVSAAFAAGVPICDGGGTYVLQTGITIQSLATSTFNQGLIFYGAGIGKTIFDNQVSSSPMFDISAGGSAGVNFLMGLVLRGFKVKRTTSETAQTAIRIKTSYMVSLEQIHIDGMTGDGIRIPCIVGDNDGSNMVSMKQVRVENCSGWGMDLSGDSGFNETSFIYMEHCFIQGCGTTSAAYQPPSGGVKWKGQILTMQQCAFTLNENCALWIPGEAGAAQTCDLQDTTFENNKNRSLFCRGVSRFKGRNLQFYNNNSYVSTNAVEFEGGSFTIRGVEIDGVVVRATSSNNPYTAFKFSGANTDLNSCRVKNVIWDNFDYTGQTRFDGLQFDFIENNCDLVAASATSLELKPRTSLGEGNKVPLRLRGGGGGTPSTTGEWIAHQIASGGLSISNASLAANTRYYCYIYDNSGAAALELSSSASFVTDTLTGYPVKSGDTTRYYVGSAMTDGSSQFILTAAGWLNPTILMSATQTGVAAYLWADSSTRLRIKYATAPTSDTDGTIVGTQT